MKPYSSELLAMAGTNFDFTTYPKRTLFTFATCLFFTRRGTDYVEVYLDEIATAAFRLSLIHI